MLIETLLNRCHGIKGFVYEKASMIERFEKEVLEVFMRPRKNAKGLCSICQKPSPTYDTAKEARRFEFIPLWGYAVVLIYCMRRVTCAEHGVKVEYIPWASGKHQMCRVYQQFLANWARRLSWSEVARIFGTSWQSVYRSVEWIVHWGLERRVLTGITAIGVDEIQYRIGHKYLTVIYQLNEGCRRLLWVGRERTAKTLLRFFRDFGKTRTAELRFICSDMWKPYLKVIKKKARHTLHILDRYHIVANLNKAIDEVRAEETRRLHEEGYEPILKHTRWCFLKREKNLTHKQSFKLRDILKYDLKSVKAYLLKEAFQVFWEYTSSYWAGEYLDKWTTQVMHSRIEPMKKMAKQIRKHQELILNWFKAKKEFSNGIVEGFNTRIKLTIRKACGFRTFNVIELALYHTLGALPEPEVTHRFW
jgi:transposase